MTSTRACDLPHLVDVRAGMHERDLVRGRVARLDVLEGRQHLGMLSERLRDRPNATDVLGMTPPGIVTPAVGVRDERDAHGAPRRRRDASSASNNTLTSAKRRAGDGCHPAP